MFKRCLLPKLYAMHVLCSIVVQVKVHLLSGHGEVSTKTLAKHRDSAHKVWCVHACVHVHVCMSLCVEE